MGELSPADATRTSTLTLDVLIAALADALDAQSTVPPHTRRRALTAQMHVFTQNNLSDPDLAPGAIAAAHRISPRYLHKLFQAEGQTVACRIRERRPVGIHQPAHLSQAFRRGSR
jgi:AraC-like DNA-binding protein